VKVKRGRSDQIARSGLGNGRKRIVDLFQRHPRKIGHENTENARPKVSRSLRGVRNGTANNSTTKQNKLARNTTGEIKKALVFVSASSRFKDIQMEGGPGGDKTSAETVRLNFNQDKGGQIKTWKKR